MSDRWKDLERRIDDLSLSCSQYTRDRLRNLLDSDENYDYLDVDIRGILDFAVRRFDLAIEKDTLSVLNDILIFRRDIFEQKANEVYLEEGYAEAGVGAGEVRRYRNSLGYILRCITHDLDSFNRIILNPTRHETWNEAESSIVTYLVVLREIDIVQHDFWLHKYRQALEIRAKEQDQWK